MVNEVVMYQSMFLLGILVFGFFAITFDNYSEYADEILLENSLEIINNLIGELIIDLVDNGQQMKSVSSSFSIFMPVTLSPDIAGENYVFYFDENSQNEVLLNVSTSRSADSISFYSLGFLNGSNLIFDGNSILFSNSQTPTIAYFWDGLTEIVRFQ